ncbi:putative ABC transporter permease [Ruminococcaceae bacterium OttesenSCG-928-L11]|nr:putative ABC transporter permease [Ruminococcaceae bacterium OttesenSCG-928-L11]
MNLYQESVIVAEEERQERSANGMHLQSLVWIFVVCSVLGVLLETIFCYIFKGYLECRQGVIYGPFNQIYGFGAVLLTVLLHKLRERHVMMVFTVSALAGGLFEVVCSLVQERVFGTVSWDYSWMPISLLGGRTNLLYMAFFGALGVVFIKVLYPLLCRWIGKLLQKSKNALTWTVAALMALNLCISGVAVARWMERQNGVPAQTKIDLLADSYYPDEILQNIYPTMVRVSQ